MNHAIRHEWVHVSYAETSKISETYGFVGSQGSVNLEGLLLRPQQGAGDTVFLMMHPASTLQLLPLPAAMAQAGHAVLCMGSRYAKNDTALIYEKVALDLNACIRHAKERLGFRNVVLLGWSGGGSLALFYQSQAQRPTITATPAGDPVDLKAAELWPADGMVLEAAHRSRARCLADWIDPSVLDENDPDRRLPEFDLYAPELAVQPPYPRDWLTAYRAAQVARVARITARVQETLEMLRKRGTAELERGFITHRTMAEPRFLDATLQPNDRPIGHCYLGVPETVNSGPVGLARFSMLRSWLSQWSLEHSRADGETCARDVTVPLLAIEHTADDAVPQPDMGLMHAACASADKQFERIQGANHYFKGQPEHLQQAITLIGDWAGRRGW
ncbi:MAG: Alpha/beta hydrolase family protein [Ramlibacter sp.]|jgi:pimeloyl-ACP methyl ester carboxylesterase|uniref:alpha/beta hydrolase family protein n=1 Tax=Ramlibacter sp. TaxID=1917967 RepID=UPI00261F7F0C|nr:alpha/beta hydrolase [Ramlibacter sp.]MDB5752102.1 Alpha/beta hydrolase family protein [Ramlibacter sp.]